jgi:hypothetical protein
MRLTISTELNPMMAARVIVLPMDVAHRERLDYRLRSSRTSTASAVRHRQSKAILTATWTDVRTSIGLPPALEPGFPVTAGNPGRADLLAHPAPAPHSAATFSGTGTLFTGAIPVPATSGVYVGTISGYPDVLLSNQGAGTASSFDLRSCSVRL